MKRAQYRVSDRWSGGVSRSDVIEAAVACRRCVNNHCGALLSRQLANEMGPIRRVLDPWVDALPQTNADGEGVE